MKKIVLYFTGLFFSLALLLPSCTDKFEDMNTNPISISDKSLEQDFKSIGTPMIPIQQMIYVNYNWGDGTNWTFQLTQNLTADIWSGYLASATPFAGNSNNQTYNVIWNDFAWDYTYAHMMTNVYQVRKKCAEGKDGEYDHFRAICDILTVEGMHRLADMYGPIIYTKYGTSGYGGAYDSQKDAYYAFFNDLTNAVAKLKAYIKANPGIKPFANFDMSYGGDYSKWIKLANSLRLRLAMRIVKVDPAKAKAEAEAAVNDDGGLLTDNEDNYTVGGYTNPLAAITSWTDISISANIESIMRGYDDPRLKIIATPALHPSANGQVKGVRSGITGLDDTTSPEYKKYSFPTTKTSDKPVLMTCAEVYFLRAEGALRGWNMGGTAKDLYETGIKKSFEQYGVAIGSYLTSTNVPMDYYDYVQPSVVSCKAVSTISPVWNDNASNEEKLEKVITQKWIAVYPEGYEGWAEVRRTGYPKLFKVIKNDSGGAISTDEGVRRQIFSQTERTLNASGVEDAIKLLNGPDTHATRVWWDVKGPNF
jgi:hypothetical protein